MEPFTLFAISALIFLVGELLRPLPESRDREAVPFSEARLPSTDPQKVVHVGWGRYKITAPQLMGVTSFFTEAIEREVRTLFKSKDVTIGFRYFAGMYLGIGSGLANVHQIFHGGVLLWDRTVDGFVSESLVNGDVISIDEPDFLGGPEAGGGLTGTIRYYRGDPTQRVDPYIASFPDHQPTPAFRFTGYFVFEDFGWGESANLSELEFVMDREPVDYLALGVNLRIEGKTTEKTEVNPMAIVADLLRNTNYGQSEPGSALNTAVLKAMGDTLAIEKNGMSLKWVREETTEKLFRTIQDQIQGTIFKKIGSGLWSGRLVRDDFDPDLIRVVDPSNIIELTSFSRRNWPETSNQAIIDWNDRDLDRKPTPAVEHDFSNFNRIGRVRADRKTFPGVYSNELAVQIAVRAIKQIAFPFASGNMTTDRTLFDAEPGEPMKLIWPPLGIESLVIRVTGVGFGTSVNGNMPLSFVEDFFSQSLANFDGLDDGVGEPVNTPPVAIITIYAFEQPYFLQHLDPLVVPPVSGVNFTVNKLGWLAKPPQLNALQYRMWEEAPAGQPVIANELSEYTAIGALINALAESTADEAVVAIDSVTLASRMLESGSATETEVKTQGFGLVLIEDGTDEEWLGCTAILDNLDGTYDITVARGLIDTLPKNWLAAARVWFVSVGLGSTENEHGSADVIDYQGENQTAIGFGPLSAVQARTFTDRVSKPYPAGDFEITDTTPSTVKYPTTPLAEGDITFTWQGRDRTAPDILFQDDAGVVEAGFEFFLTIYDNTNPGSPVVLRRVGRGASGSPGTNENVVLSGESYVWTAAKQLVDDPSGIIAAIRVDLRTQGDTITFVNTIFNREDVTRDFNRTVVIPSAVGGYRTFVEAESGLTAYWPLDEIDNAASVVETVSDIATTRNGGAASGSRPTIVDAHTYGASADGLHGSYFEGADDPAYDFGDTWSLILWFAVGDVSVAAPLLVRNATNDNIDVYVNNVGRIVVIIRDTDAAPFVFVQTNQTGFDDGLPHQVAVTHDSGGGASPFSVYVDGHLEVTSPNTNQPYTGSGPLQFVGTSSAGFTVGMRGLMGHVQLYDVEKTAAQIRANYETGRRSLPFEIATKKAAPNFWWRLNDFTAAGAGTNVVDWGFGGSPVDGTKTNTPTERVAGPLEAVQPSWAFTFDEASDERVALGSGLLTGDSHGALSMWFKSAGTATLSALFAAGNAGGARLFLLDMQSTGELRMQVRFVGGESWILLTDGTFDDDEWHHVTVRKPTAGSTAEFVIDSAVIDDGNGATLTLAGAFDGTEWIEDIDDVTLEYNIGILEGSALFFPFDGEISDVQVWREAAPTRAAAIAQYAGGVAGYRGASDIMLDEELHHLFELVDFNAVDDVLDNMNAVTGAWNSLGGNTHELDQLPMAADDPDGSLYIPRDGTAANAVYVKFTARAFLEAAGLQNFHDFGYIMQTAWEFDDASGMVFSNSNAANSALNLFSERKASPAGIDHQKFPASNRGIQTVAKHAERGRVLSNVLREEFVSANADPDLVNADRRWLSNQEEAAYGTLDAVNTGDNDPTKAEIYTGVDMDDGYLFVFGGTLTDDNRNFGGLVGRIAFWDRPPSRFRGFLQNLRALGWQEHPLVVRAHEPLIYLRLDDPTGSIAMLDVSGNENNGALAGTAVFDAVADRSNVWHEDKGVGNLDQAGNAGIVVEDVANFPTIAGGFTFGGWFRSAGGGKVASAYLYDNAADPPTAWQFGGLADDGGGDLKVTWQVAGDTAEQGSTTVADSAWAFLVFVVNSASDVDAYLAGELEANFAASTAAGTLDSFALNSRDDTNQIASDDGSYHDVWLVDEILTAEQIREAYVRALQPTFDQVAEAFNPTGFWPLEDYEIADVFRNRTRDSAGHNIYGAGTGVVQASPGILPNYPASCVDFDGTGEIDTAVTEYQTGSGNRAFAVWIEQGFTGVVWSMGANVDAQALIVSVDGSGDVTVAIRGGGNARTWTTALDTGGDHFLVVQLVGDSLHDFEVWIDHVEETTIGTAGTDTTLNTVATLNLKLGSDTTDQGGADGNGKLSRAVMYSTNLTAEQIAALDDAGTVA